MAVSSSAATTLYISQKSFPIPKSKNVILSNSVTFGSPKPRKFQIKSSSEGSLDETTVTEEADPESSIEVPKGPPSLISALNVERALRGIPITDVDHYGRLGLPRGCSDDQVKEAYRSKVEELKSQELQEEELENQIELLKESYTIMSTAEERRLYDWSLARIEKPERFVWPYEVDKTKPPQQPPPPQEPEDVGPTRLVGYFMLGWFLLSIVLSIAFNR